MPFFHGAVTLALGMLSQVAAARIGAPAIVVLLLVGVVAGPDGIGLLDPTSLGAARNHLVALAVTVILFDGALGLRLEELRRQRRSLLLLMTLGAVISMIVGMVAAHQLLGMEWPIATLYGALMIVTGPTVVTPILSRLSIDRRVRELLISEGVLIDPLGAIVAIVAAEWVLGHAPLWEAGPSVFLRLGVGAAMGAGGGVLMATALRLRIIPQELRNSSVLASVLVLAAAASQVSSEAGLMAAVAQGVAMGNAGLPELGRLRHFKEELTTILLSFLFVLLAAGLPLRAVADLGWRGPAVVAVVVWIGRPLAVFASTAGSDLSARQKLFVAWMCPRGIVAASVAGLFGFLLAEAGIGGGDELEALVFVTVALTVTVQGLTADRVAHLLRLDAPKLEGSVIVGADALGRVLARVLTSLGRHTVLVDSSSGHCGVARADGLAVLCADALSPDALEEAGARYAHSVVALTRNRELNTLVAQRVRDAYRPERVLWLGTDTEPRVLFSGDFSGIDEVNRGLAAGTLRVVRRTLSQEMAGRPLAELDFGPGQFALVLQRGDAAWTAALSDVVASGDVVHLLSP